MHDKSTSRTDPTMMRKVKFDPTDPPLCAVDWVTFCDTVSVHFPFHLLRPITKLRSPAVGPSSLFVQARSADGPARTQQTSSTILGRSTIFSVLYGDPWPSHTGTDEWLLFSLLTFAQTHIMLSLIRAVVRCIEHLHQEHHLSLFGHLYSPTSS